MMSIEVLDKNTVKIDVDENMTEKQALSESILAIAGMIRFFSVQDDNLARVFVDAAKNFLSNGETISICIGDMTIGGLQ